MTSIHDQALGLAERCESEGRLPEAERLYRYVLSRDGAHPEACRRLGLLLQRLGNDSGAARHLEKAQLATGGDAALLRVLGCLQHRLGALDAARETLEAACRAAPDEVETWLALSRVLVDAGQADHATTLLVQLVERCPMVPEPPAELARLLAARGLFAEAASVWRRCIDANPCDGEAYYGLALLPTGFLGVEDAAPMEAALAAGDVPQEDRVLLGLALGHLLERDGRYAAAFDCFREANRRHRATYRYSADDQESFFERHRQAQHAAALQAVSGAAVDDEVPIIVIGMPRSGTSLVEQILASHPHVYGAGEVEYSRLVVDAVVERTSKPFPLGLESVPGSTLREAALLYCRRLRDRSPDARRVVDKLPHNFLRLGLLAALLPRAHIVHCRRDPLDTCLSIFQHHFASAHGYAADLHELGRYYRLYTDLMLYWEGLLPGRIHELRYEHLIADFEGSLRRLLDFCELPMHQACLDFHADRRVVVTPSAGQVRQPLYGGAVGRWKAYEAQLRPLAAALQGR